MKNLLKRVIAWLAAPVFAEPPAPTNDRVAETLRGIEVRNNVRGTDAL